MKSKHTEFIKFVLEAAESAPLQKRIDVYRGLADLLGDKDECAKLIALADALEQADKATRQFAFDFSLKH